MAKTTAAIYRLGTYREGERKKRRAEGGGDEDRGGKSGKAEGGRAGGVSRRLHLAVRGNMRGGLCGRRPTRAGSGQ